MKAHIKNMISLRCIICVKAVLDKLNIGYQSVTLGEIILLNELPEPLYLKLAKELEAMDLFFIDNKKSVIIEAVKHAAGAMLRNAEPPRENYSTFICNVVGYNYTYLANLFSQHEGITIEHYIILQKIEMVKQLLLQQEFTLTEISSKFHYSSVAHLSSQFKKVTGMTPSQFRHLHDTKTIADEVS
jgi:AraC-like DNA-binding protein